MTSDDDHEAYGAMMHRQRTEAAEAMKELRRKYPTRKIVQISYGNDCDAIGLCNDGSIWLLEWVAGINIDHPGAWEWKRLPDIPQDE